MFKRFFQADPLREAARALHVGLIKAARQPWLYKDLAVPDSLDGRFEMIALHLFILLRRLKTLAEGRALGSALADEVIADLDRSLREMGVGDIGVSHRIKAMAKALYGRIDAYHRALENTQPDGLEAALTRNAYGTMADPPARKKLEALRNYLQSQIKFVENGDVQSLLRGVDPFSYDLF